jgi:hypothetical protein
MMSKLIEEFKRVYGAPRNGEKFSDFELQILGHWQICYVTILESMREVARGTILSSGENWSNVLNIDFEELKKFGE